MRKYCSREDYLDLSDKEKHQLSNDFLNLIQNSYPDSEFGYHSFPEINYDEMVLSSLFFQLKEAGHIKTVGSMKFSLLSKGLTPDVRTIEAHCGGNGPMAITADGKYIITNRDPNMRIWDFETGELVNTLQGHKTKVTSIKTTSDNKYIISGSVDGIVKVWELKTGKPVHNLKGHKDIVWSIAVTNDNLYIISGSKDKTMKIWNLKKGELITSLEQRNEVSHVETTYDSKYIIYITKIKDYKDNSWPQLINIWDITSKRLVLSIDNEAIIEDITVTPNGKYIILGLANCGINIREFATGRLIQHIEGHKIYNSAKPCNVFAVSITPDSKYIVSGSWDKTLKIWNIETGFLVDTLVGHTQQIYSVTVTSDGNYIVSNSPDGTVKVWRNVTKEL